MNISPHHFPNVSLLITHYNRSASLERLLYTFSQLGLSFGEVIVSDDCSSSEHLQHLFAVQKQYSFRLITVKKNGGLANNLNKGQRAVTLPYTLYVQEDFIPLAPFYKHFQDALQFMEEDPELDLARFYAYTVYPYLEPYRAGFSRMIYKPWFLNTHKIYNYSDHPHLRRSNFLERFGAYKEGIKSDKTEYEMCLSFIRHQGKAIFYDAYTTLFLQENSAAEPSTVQRSSWREGNSPLISSIRWIYRQLKYNYDLHIRPENKK